MNLIGTIVVYVGLLAVLVGGLSVLRPLTFLRIWSRVQGVILLVVGVAVFLIGVNLPAGETRVASPSTRLDEFVPAYQFGEFHSIRIQAPRERGYAALRDVTANEILLFRTLTWVRRLGQPGPESILNPPSDKPLLDVALRTSFVKLAEEPGREIVLGTLLVAPKGTGWKDVVSAPSTALGAGERPDASAPGEPLEARGKQVAGSKKDPTPEDFRALNSPGFALGVINFRLEDAGNGETLLTTETRVFATDASVRRNFAAYWRVIYPGSALLRVTWLRAIKHRAETKE